MTHLHTVTRWYKDRVWRVSLRFITDNPDYTYNNPTNLLFQDSITAGIVANTSGPLRKRVGWDRFKQNNTYQHVCNYTVYLRSAPDYLWVCTQYADHIVDTCAPADDRTATLLLNGIDIEIKTHLYYKRYQYRVTFTHYWRDTVMPVVVAAVAALGVNAKQQYQLTRDGYLYLASELELTMIKLQLGEHIRNITVVQIDPGADTNTDRVDWFKRRY